jgi:hypothetical protein
MHEHSCVRTKDRHQCSGSSHPDNPNNVRIADVRDCDDNWNNKDNYRASSRLVRVAEGAESPFSDSCNDRRMTMMESGLTIDAVFNAYFDCRKTKRNSINQLRFEVDLEPNLVELYNRTCSTPLT